MHLGQTAAVTGFGITVQNGNSALKHWGLTPIHTVFKAWMSAAAMIRGSVPVTPAAPRS